MTYAPGPSATNAPSGSIDAPAPLTDHRIAAGAYAALLSVVADAEKCTTSPVRARVVRGLTTSDRTGFATTVIVIAADAGPLMATIRAFPGAMPVTRPAASMVATA